jgi:hypothetical protein
MRCASIAAALLALAGACGCGGGGGDGLVEEDALRVCLADGGISVDALAPATGPGLGNVSADFSATTAEGVGVNAVVQGTEQKARRTAADVRAALGAFGASESEVVVARNAIVVFAGTPSDEALEVTQECLG